MGTKHLKFVAVPEAITEIKKTLLMLSELKKREELEPLLRQLEDLHMRKGRKKVHPLEFVSRDGLWIKYHGSEQFYYGIDLVEFFLNLLSSKSVETVSEVYSEIEWVQASVARHPKTGVTGLLVETEMEKFECIQCGHCCLNLSGAYQTSVPESDIKRWKREQRFDILEWVGPFEGMDEIWISPKTGEYVNRCPWLRKLPKQNKYICRIHEAKPEHCRNFPKSKRHALDNGCKGFSAD
ncbi:MAG: YkgJ family cysteine cluster protein [Desulfobacterales bacterium]|jgi:Fe-S-cluster containining protein